MVSRIVVSWALIVSYTRSKDAFVVKIRKPTTTTTNWLLTQHTKNIKWQYHEPDSICTPHHHKIQCVHTHRIPCINPYSLPMYLCIHDTLTSLCTNVNEMNESREEKNKIEIRTHNRMPESGVAEMVFDFRTSDDNKIHKQMRCSGIKCKKAASTATQRQKRYKNIICVAWMENKNHPSRKSPYVRHTRCSHT